MPVTDIVVVVRQACDPRRLVRRCSQLDAVSMTANLCLPDRSVETALMAVKHRLEFDDPEGKDECHVIEECPGNPNKILRPFSRRFLGMVPSSSPRTPTEFASTYTGRKRALYTRAAQELMIRGWRNKDAFIKAFVKVDKMQIGKHARIIQPRTPVFNVAVGCYIKHLEHTLYGILNSMFGGPPTVMKGCNATVRAKTIEEVWSLYENPGCIGMDAHRFDEHIRSKILKFEHNMWMAFYRTSVHRHQLRELFKAMESGNRGIIICPDGSIRYKLPAQRASGDMDTASGNVMIMCAALYSLRVRTGLKFSVVCDGDDSLLIAEQSTLDKLRDSIKPFFAELGIVMKVEKMVTQISDISFCQSHWALGANGPVMVRDFPGSLEKDSIIIKPMEHLLKRYLYTLGKCGLALTAGVPVVQNLYRAMVLQGDPRGLSDPSMETGMAQLAHGMPSPKFSIPTDGARLAFAKAFHVSPYDQVLIERHYDAITFKDDDVDRSALLMQHQPLG